jgi:hypothetical protein
MTGRGDTEGSFRVALSRSAAAARYRATHGSVAGQFWTINVDGQIADIPQ